MWSPAFASQRVLDAADAADPRCMNCGGPSDESELLHTGVHESLEGWEIWVRCDGCGVETFCRLDAPNVVDSSGAVRAGLAELVER